MRENIQAVIEWLLVIAIIGVLVAGLAYLWPKWNVWRSEIAIERIENEGKATLAKAEQERKTRVAQAQAELEAAKYTSEAMRIVGEMAKRYPEYRQQEFILAYAEALKDRENKMQVIYVPTEGGIPITEAGRFAK